MRLKKTLLLPFLSAFILSSAANASLTPVNSSGIHGRIVGGIEATPGEFPFMVSLQRATSSRPFCGGSLIAEQWVLTAAHCVSGITSTNTVVRLGHHRVTDTEGTERHFIQRVYAHPQYNNGTLDYDYALLHLATPSKFAAVALQTQEIDIPDTVEEAPVATVMGFGALREGGPQSNVLMKVEKPLVSATKCDAAYPGDITDRMICSGLFEGGKDSCQGDSGGPLVLIDQTAQPVLSGVVSWGIGCARPQKYGVYSKVSAVTEWISTTMESSVR